MRRYDDPDPYDPLTEGGAYVDQGGGMYGGPNPPDPPQVDTGKDKVYRRGRIGAGHRSIHGGSAGMVGPFTSDWFNTTLEPHQEQVYQQWLKQQHVPQSNDYDMRGYYKMTGGAEHSAGQHFPDTFKKPNHPTFSNESIYAKGPFAAMAGRWQGEGPNAKYVPAGVPTAEQEALRDPRVDPVFMLAGGISGGLERAGEHMLLRQSIIDNLMKAFPEAARGDFVDAMGSAVPRWANEFGRGMIRPMTYGATSQTLLANPNHPQLAHYGSLPVGGNATAYTARLSDYAQQMANRIPKLPNE